MGLCIDNVLKNKPMSLKLLYMHITWVLFLSETHISRGFIVKVTNFELFHVESPLDGGPAWVGAINIVALCEIRSQCFSH